MDSERTRSSVRDGIAAYADSGLMMYLVLFIVEVAIFFLVSSLPFLPGEKALYSSQGNHLANEFAGADLFTLFWGIFTNNLRIALLEMVPGLGAALFAFSIYSTARIVEVLALNYSPPVAAPALVVSLFLLPHSYIELPAYAVATGEGIYLLVAIWRWAFSKGPGSPKLSAEGWQFAINLMLVIVMLAVAATFESAEIVVGEPYSLLSWVPFIVLMALTVVAYRKLRGLNDRKRAELPPVTNPGDSSNLPS